jgi:T1SS-143 domain-containing protein
MQAIGKVIFISGLAKAIDTSGNERVLTINSTVYLGETIITAGNDSRLLLKMDNNQLVTLGRNDKLSMDQDIYDPYNVPVEESIASVDQIQEALLNDPNFDPGNLEAPAAGETSAGDSSISAPVVITHNPIDVEFEFLDTVGINNNISNPDIRQFNDESLTVFANLSLSGSEAVFESDTARYTISVDNAPLADLILEITISHKSTTAEDLIAQTLTLTLPAGSTTVSFDIGNFDNLLAEPDEQYQVSIASISGGGYAGIEVITEQLETRIIDDNDPVTIQLIALDKDGNELSATANTVIEGEQASYLAVMLSPSGERMTVEGTVQVALNGQTASENSDFNANTQTVSLGVPFTVDIVDDVIQDSGETFAVELVAGSFNRESVYEQVNYSENAITTTINDEASPEPMVISLFAADTSGQPLKDSNGNYLQLNQISEGDAGHYVVLAFNPGTSSFNDSSLAIEQLGQVEVQISNGSATGINRVNSNTLNGTEDFNNPGTLNVELGQVFDINTFNDYAAESNENFSLAIQNGSYQDSASGRFEAVDIRNDILISEITDAGPAQDEDAVYAIITGSSQVIEGDSAQYTVQLIDANGQAVIVTQDTDVTVRYSNQTTQNGDTPFNQGQTVNLTILANQSSVNFLVATLDDQPVENQESFSWSIDSIQDNGDYERLIAGNKAGLQGSILTTIIDINDTPVAQNDAAVAVEAGSASFDGTGQDNNVSLPASGNVLTNDSDIDTLQTQLSVIGIQSDQTSNTAVQSGSSLVITGLYGELEIQSDGSYEYRIDNNNLTVQQLNQGNSLQESFTYTVSDNEISGALSDTATLSITINGTNDAPDAVAELQNIIENDSNVGIDTTNTVNGNVLGNDSDIDNNALSVTSVAHGLSLNRHNGNDQALILDDRANPLLSGASEVSLSLSLASTETGNGGLLSFASNANNNDFLLFMNGNQLSLYLDGPSVNTGITRAELFDGNSHNLSLDWRSDTGQVNFYLDGQLQGTRTIGQGHTLGNGIMMLGQEQDSIGGGLDASQAVSMVLHSLNISTNASATSNASWNFNELNGNQINDNQGQYTLSIDNSVSHSTGATIANTESVQIINNTVPVTLSGAYGQLTLNADGSYQYDLYDHHPEVDALNSNETLQEQFTYTISDNETGVEKFDTATLTLTINGTNDAPLVRDDNGTAVEEGTGHAYLGQQEDAIIALGNVLTNDSDVDNETLSVIQIEGQTINAGDSLVITGQYGSLEIFSNGDYRYTANDNDPRVDALNRGDSLSEQFDYVGSDGDKTGNGQLTITIEGRDDKPQAIANAKSIQELADDETSQNQIIGNLILDNSLTGGTDSDVDNAINDLFIAGAANQGVAVNMSGGNNQALIYDERTSADLFSGASQLDVSITLSSSETTGSQSILSYASNLNNDFLLFVNGNSLDLYLATGRVSTGITRSELFDGNQHTLRTVWNNTNGEAEFYLDGVLQGTATIGQGHVLGRGAMMLGQEQDSIGGNLDASQTLSATYYDMQINTDIASAQWDMNAIVSGQINDTSGNHPLSINNNVIHSQNSGQSQANDNDVFISSDYTPVNNGTVINLQYGVITINPDGSYDYELNDAHPDVQALKTGQTLTESWAYTLSDGQKIDTADLTITINGTNDRPVLDLNGSAAGNDYSTTYKENQPAISIADINSLIADVDDQQLESATIVLKDYQALEDVLDTSGVSGLSIASAAPAGNDYVIQLTGSASLDTYIQAIQSITYQNTSETPNENRSLSIEVTVTDGEANSNTAITTINLDAAPDATDNSAEVTEGLQTVTGNVLNDDDQGSGNAQVYQFTYLDELGNLQTANANEVVNTQYGQSFTIHSDGSWTYTSDQSEQHLDAANQENNRLPDNISYTVIDSNGDISPPANLVIDILDTEVQIGSPVNNTVFEENLANGSSPDASALTVSGDLDVTSGADSFETRITTQTAPAGLTSAGLPVTYSLAADGQTLTASTTAGNIFIVSLNNSNNDNAGYEFELLKPLDHTTALSDINLVFNVEVNDSDNDTQDASFNITLVDDNPVTSINLVVNEDSSQTINTSADSTQANTTISTNGQYGTATVNPDGSITYTPDANYSGADEVKYTTTLDDGTIRETTVNIIVDPVADTPLMDANKVIVTYEDNSYDPNTNTYGPDQENIINLGLSIPQLVDIVDQNNLLSGDNAERLELIQINIRNAKDGQLLDSDGNIIINTISDNNETYRFYIVDNTGDTTPSSSYHYAGLNTNNAIALTQAQYEGLQITQTPDDASGDIRVQIRTRAHEVEDDGTRFAPDVRSAWADQTINIRVHAVTDPVSLDENAVNTDGVADGIINVSIAEDSVLDLRPMLINTFGDLDNSERHFYDVSGLQPGTQITINGQTRTANNSGDISQVRFNGTETDFTLKPPADWDGNMNAITITLISRDTDSSNQRDAIREETDTITLNLNVTPVAGDVDIFAPAPGLEDSAIYLFRDQNNAVTIQATDNSGSSNDTITGVKILTSDLQGSTLSGAPVTSDGLYTVFDITRLADYQITPPAHSSADLVLELVVTTTDGASTVDTIEPAYTVTVAPVAERNDSDSDGDAQLDVLMNGDHAYGVLALEDQWFDLNSDIDLKSSWSNQDNSEALFAVLSADNGSQFRYSTDNGSTWTVQTISNGNPVDIPVEYLDTVQFMAPAQAAGDFTIGVQAKTIDYDEDDTSISQTNISGNAALQVFVAPVADAVNINVSQSYGYEDSGRNAEGIITNNGQDGIPMKVAVKSDDTDGSESFNLKIEDIPSGAAIAWYDQASGQYQLFDAAVSGTSLIISQYDSNKPFYLVPAHNSNDDVNLKISAQSVESDGSTSAFSPAVTTIVNIKGVADNVIQNELNEITVAGQDYNAVIAEDQVLNLSLVFAAPDQIQSYDNDGSESLTMVLTGLAEDFDIQGATFMGGTGPDREWILPNSELNNVSIIKPEHFSGELSLSIKHVVTENDGSVNSQQNQSVSVLIQPVSEAVLIANDTVFEDTPTALSFDINNQGDTNEVLSQVWIKADSVPAGVSLKDADNNDLTADVDGYIKLSNSDAISNVWVHLPPQSDMPDIINPDAIGGFDLSIKYITTDHVNDTSAYEDVKTSDDVTFSVAVQAVADKPVLSLDDNALITFASDGNSYVALASTPGQNNEYTLNFELASQDRDGSETAQQFRLSGIPDGMFVKGGIYAGDIEGTDTGIWYLDFNTPAGSGQSSAGISTQDITLIVGPDTFTGNDDRYAIEITGTNVERRGGDSQTADPYILFVGYSDAVSPNTPSVNNVNEVADDLIVTLIDPIEVLEDAPLLLTDIINVQQNDTSELLSVNIHGLPDGSTVSNAEREVDSNGQVFWVARTMDAQIQLPENLNDNNRGSSLDNIVLNVTSSEESGDSISYSITVPGDSITIKPVTDTPSTSLQLDFADEFNNVVTEAVEDGSVAITLTIDTVDNAQSYPQPGQYATPAAEVLIKLLNGEGVLEGYTLDAGLGGWLVPFDQLSSLRFLPDEHYSGDVRLQYSVQMTEANADLSSTVNGNIDFTVKPVVDGFNIPDTTVLTASGLEDTYVELDLTSLSLTDVSETVIAALLKQVPAGVLVYIGDNHETLANNAGGDASGNTWNIKLNADGSLPKIWFKPEENISGNYQNISLSTIVADGTEVGGFDYDVHLEVEAVADGIDIRPVSSEGKEGSDIPLNLNSIVIDLDASETVILTLKGLGENALFKVDGQFMSLDNVDYDKALDTYTLDKIEVSQLDKLSFLQESLTGQIDISAWTVESSNNQVSASDDESFSINITANTSDDTLIGSNDNDIVSGFSGNDILSGLDGDDILFAGSGNDTMSGGNGNDLFISSAGQDLISDYQNDGVETDTLVLTDLLETEETYLLDHLSVEDNGANQVKINVLDDQQNPTGHSVTLENMTFDSLLGQNDDERLQDLLTKVTIDNEVI